MDEIQRFVIPAILAFLLHGVLANFTIQKNPISAPKLTGSPISININSTPPEPSPNDQQVLEKKEIKSESLPPEAMVKQTESTSIPTIEPHRMKKIIKPQEVKQNSERRNEVVRKSKEEPLPPKIKDYKLNQNAKPLEAIDEIVVDEILEEERSSVLERKKAIPVYRHNDQPQYPVMAKRRGYQGEVTLNVLVASQGIVSEVKIKTTSGHSSLDKAAMSAVKRWQFIPATIDGKPVNMWVDVPIDFRLQ